MSTDREIKIIDVIHHYSTYSMQVMVVVDRMPEYVYERTGNNLAAHDSGFYDHMYIGGGTDAFAGRKFDIRLTDGSTFHCHGQVWSGRGNGVALPEPIIEVGVCTLEKLAECYCFIGGHVSVAKVNAWLAENRPSYNYRKYEERETLDGLKAQYAKFPGADRPVSAKRARKLRQRGVTIRCNPETGRFGWSKSYERRKAEILRWRDPDYRGPFYDPAMYERASTNPNKEAPTP